MTLFCETGFTCLPTGSNTVHVLPRGQIIVSYSIVSLTITMVSQGALTLLNVETGLDTVSELEAIGAFIVLLLLTEDLKDKKK